VDKKTNNVTKLERRNVSIRDRNAKAMKATHSWGGRREKKKRYKTIEGEESAGWGSFDKKASQFLVSSGL